MNARTQRKGASLNMLWLPALVFAASCWTSALFAQVYEPGPEPTVGEVQHQAWYTIPANRDRTVIGAREWILLSIDENTWEDKDMEVDEETGEELGLVDDAIGDVTWEACPDNGEFWPPVGASTRFEAGYYGPDDEFESIYVTIEDSGTMFEEEVHRFFDLQVLVPTENRPFWYRDWILGTPRTPYRSMGAQTDFVIQVLPDTVNFRDIKIKEIVEAQTFEGSEGNGWPDETDYTVPPSERLVDLGIIILGDKTLHNAFIDRINAGGLWNIDHLYDEATERYEDAYFRPVQQLLFQSSETDFDQYDETEHPRWFSGNLFECEVGWKSSEGEEKTQDPDCKGPYADPPAK